MSKLVAKGETSLDFPNNIVYKAKLLVTSVRVVSNCEFAKCYIDLGKEARDRAGEELNDYLFNTIKHSLLCKINELQDEYGQSYYHAGFVGAFSDIRQLVLETFKENKVEVEWA